MKKEIIRFLVLWIIGYAYFCGVVVSNANSSGYGKIYNKHKQALVVGVVAWPFVLPLIK